MDYFSEKSPVFKPIPTYIVNNFVQQMMTQNTLNEYYHYINECNFLLNQINTILGNRLWIENNLLYLSINNDNINCSLDNVNDVEVKLSNHFKQQIKILQNIEELVQNKRNHPQITYIPLFLIPTINYNIIYIFDIYNKNKSYTVSNNNYYNLFTYTPLLTKRFEEIREDKHALDKIHSSFLNEIQLDDKLANEYFIKRFLQALTINKNSEYIVEWLKYFFKTLKRVPEALVMIGDRNISEDIFLNKIIKPIFEPVGINYCITLTDDMLESKSISEIITNKLFLHINHVPENENNKKKLKELLIKVLTLNTSENTTIICQVLITIELPHPFLKDFLSSSKVFFIDTLDNMKDALNKSDELSIHKSIYNNLEYFATQLTSVKEITYNHQYNYDDDTLIFREDHYKSDNKLFENWLKNPELMKLPLFYNSANPILDPFNDIFEKIIPTEDRHKHTYVTGKTGSGKSELLKTLIYRDIKNENCSVILLDIHGDLAEGVTRLVDDKERLVLINPILEKDMSPTINLFQTNDKSEENIEQISQMITAIINNINVGDNPSGTMIDILENCIPLLVRSENMDFKDLKRLMKDIPKSTGKSKEEKEIIQEKRNIIQSKLNKFRKNEFEEEYFKKNLWKLIIALDRQSGED